MDGGGERKIKHDVMFMEGSSGFLWWLDRGGEVAGCRNCTSAWHKLGENRTKKKKFGFGLAEHP